ncbi:MULTISPECIES: hypothetical protein [Bacillaceae]|uniref:Uncharacterized protein n=1 Tax=Evansella alkalicola TaxID=745819 RepID=A0ABS6JY48_9BACI|nr:MULTISPECIES: hypothetical protein [Bacillaceae]MBU9723515.1 hypothetical protein [Bacillus alkalicola]
MDTWKRVVIKEERRTPHSSWIWDHMIQYLVDSLKLQTDLNGRGYTLKGNRKSLT